MPPLYCSDDDLENVAAGLSITPDPQTAIAAVVVVTHNRPDYLTKTLHSVQAAYDKDSNNLHDFPLYVSQDGHDQATRRVVVDAPEFKGRWGHLEHDQSEPVVYEKSARFEAESYYRISAHYRWFLHQLFECRGYSKVIILEDDMLVAEGHGTQVTVELEGRYQKGRASVDEYLEQTAIANPHAKFSYLAPSNEDLEYPRAVGELPPEAKEIQPHPKGIELGTLIQMLERTEQKQLGAFFKDEFCRVGPRVAKEICTKADLTSRTWVKQVGHDDAERLFKAIQDVRIMAPPTDCLVPIGTKAMLAGLLKEVKAEFFAASSRPAAVYRGNPFLIEVGIAYGGQLAGDDLGRVIRFANRVPLLYQQSACCSFKAVVETGWRNYGMQQARGALPTGPAGNYF